MRTVSFTDAVAEVGPAGIVRPALISAVRPRPRRKSDCKQSSGEATSIHYHAEQERRGHPATLGQRDQTDGDRHDHCPSRAAGSERRGRREPPSSQLGSRRADR